jgi:HK97 family phage portal protein
VDDVVGVSKWGRDVVRYSGNATRHYLRRKSLNPRAIEARQQKVGLFSTNEHAGSPQRDQRILSDTETDQPTIWRCIEVVAEDAAKVPLLMFEGTPEDRGEQLTGDAHPMLELLRRPAPDVSATVWRQNVFTDIRAAGDWFSYVYTDTDNKPTSFSRFRPADIEVEPDPTGNRLVSHYEWETADAQGVLGFTGDAKKPIPVDRMAHIKTRNPHTELRGLGALARLRFQIQMDEVMQTWNWGRYSAGIPTQYLVFFNGQLGDDEREEVEQDLRKKVAGPRGDNFWLVEGNGDGQSEFKVELLPRPTEDELAFLDSEQRLALRIIMAFGVPPLKIMDLSQTSVIANADIQERLYWEDTIPSVHAHFVDFLNEFARLWYFEKGSVFFEYDYSNIRALKKSEQEQMTTMTGYCNSGVLTRNEVREAIGWAPIPPDDERYVEGLDQFLVGNNKLGSSPIAGLFGPPPAAEDEDEDDVDDDDEPMDDFTEPEDDDPALDDDKVVHIRPKLFEDLMGMLDLDEEKDRFDRAVRRKLFAMMKASGEQALDAAGVVGSFDATHPKVFQALDTQVVQMTGEIVTNTNNAVRSAVADGLAAGDAVASMRQRVQDAFKVRREPWQLDRISRTEVHAAQEGGGQLAAEQNGVEMKQWVTARDSRVRGLEFEDDADHAGIEKAGPIPIGAPFVDTRSGAKLMFPGDRSGALSGADTINCRCASVPDFSHLDKADRPGKAKSLDAQWFAKADTFERWLLDFKRTLKSYLLGMQRRAMRRFDQMVKEGDPSGRQAAG